MSRSRERLPEAGGKLGGGIGKQGGQALVLNAATAGVPMTGILLDALCLDSKAGGSRVQQQHLPRRVLLCLDSKAGGSRVFAPMP